MKSTTLAAYAVLIVAGLSRFYRVAYPARVVLDEVHFGKFINWILNREFLFDVFPPFGKMVLAASSMVFGWDQSFDFSAPGAVYDISQGYAEVRAFNAAFGALSSMIIVLICTEAGMSLPSSVFGGLLSAFDNLSIVQSRIIMADSIMILCAELSLLCAFRGFRGCRQKGIYLPWIVTAGFFSGLALATKWTSFATPFTIGFICFFGVPPFLTDGPLSFPSIAAFLISLMGSYYGVFDLFLRICNRTGQGDPFMSQKFQHSLLGSSIEGGEEMPIYLRIWELNRKMFEYQKGVRGDKSSGASWLDWIFNLRGSLYSIEQNPLGSKLIYMLMNPFMGLLINFATIGLICSLMLYIRYRKSSKTELEFMRVPLQRGATFLLAWFGSMLPTVVVYRHGQLYQYLPALVYGQLLTAQFVDMLPPPIRLGFIALCLPPLIIAFNFWAPWTYEYFLTHAEHKSRMLLSGWTI